MGTLSSSNNGVLAISGQKLVDNAFAVSGAAQNKGHPPPGVQAHWLLFGPAVENEPDKLCPLTVVVKEPT